MTGEATDLVARLRERATYDKKFYPPADPMWTEAATLIEAQAAEIEGLRKALEPFARALSAFKPGFDHPDYDLEPLSLCAGEPVLDMITKADLRRAFLASRTERGDADPS